MDEPATDVSPEATSGRRIPPVVGVLGKLAFGTAWWFGATNLALGYIRSCQASDSAGLFAALPVYPLAWIVALVLIWPASWLVTNALRRGPVQGTLTLIATALLALLLTWAYAAIFVSAFSDPFALAHFCATPPPWWPSWLPMP